MRLPTFDEAHLIGRFLFSLADDEDATARALAKVQCGNPAKAEARARVLRRAAEMVAWMAGRSDRLRDLEEPVHLKINRYGGGKR